jgi:hypothetical protein
VRSRSLIVLACAIVVAIPQSAGAVALLPPAGKVFTGVAMGYDLSDFVHRTGHKPAVWEQFIAWNHSYSWAIRLAEQQGTRLMLALSTAPGQDQAGTISPGAIAAGRGDRWLLALKRDLDDFGAPVYLRFLGEMNNCHNAYAPMACSGASRGRAYSAGAYIRAYRHVAKLLRADGSQIAMVWSPMTGGSPMVSSLDPSRFWPGRRYVDWVATSFYSKFPRFDWLSAFYARFAGRHRLPFMFAEWAMWENGNPGFVRQVLGWTRSHRRTRMLVYNQGKRTDGPFRLDQFPAAASVLHDGLQAGLFS